MQKYNGNIDLIMQHYLERVSIACINVLQTKKLSYFDYGFIYYVYQELYEYNKTYVNKNYKIAYRYLLIEKMIIERFGSIITFYELII